MFTYIRSFMPVITAGVDTDKTPYLLAGGGVVLVAVVVVLLLVEKKRKK